MEANKELQVEVKNLTEMVADVINKAEAKSKETTAAMEAKMAELAETIKQGSATEIAEAKAALQAQYDEFVTKGKPATAVQEKSLNEGINDILSQ